MEKSRRKKNVEKMDKMKLINGSNSSLLEQIDQPLRVFDLSSKNIHLKDMSFLNVSVKPEWQILQDKRSFDNFETEDESLKFTELLGKSKEEN